MKAFFTILIISLVTLLGCEDKEEKQISELLSIREEAFEKKNSELYLACISSSYRVEVDGDIKTKESLLKDFKANTTPFDRIDISHKDRTIYQSNNEAKVVQKTKVILQIEGQTSNYELTEIIKLVKENKNWKISKESKIDLFRGFVFGKN